MTEGPQFVRCTSSPMAAESIFLTNALYCLFERNCFSTPGLFMQSMVIQQPAYCCPPSQNTESFHDEPFFHALRSTKILYPVSFLFYFLVYPFICFVFFNIYTYFPFFYKKRAYNKHCLPFHLFSLNACWNPLFICV